MARLCGSPTERASCQLGYKPIRVISVVFFLMCDQMLNSVHEYSVYAQLVNI